MSEAREEAERLANSKNVRVYGDYAAGWRDGVLAQYEALSRPVSEAEVEAATVGRANFARAKHGLPPLTYPEVLDHVDAEAWKAETRAALEAARAVRDET